MDARATAIAQATASGRSCFPLFPCAWPCCRLVRFSRVMMMA